MDVAKTTNIANKIVSIFTYICFLFLTTFLIHTTWNGFGLLEPISFGQALSLATLFIVVTAIVVFTAIQILAMVIKEMLSALAVLYPQPTATNKPVAWPAAKKKEEDDHNLP